MEYLLLFSLTAIQSITGTLSIRAKNRSNLSYALTCTAINNSVWFFTLMYLVTGDMILPMVIPYVTGAVLGAAIGVKVSIWIENLIGARP